MKEIRKELLDELLEGYEGPEDLLGEAGLLERLQKALMERVFGAELTEHLGPIPIRGTMSAIHDGLSQHAGYISLLFHPVPSSSLWH